MSLDMQVVTEQLAAQTAQAAQGVQSSLSTDSINSPEQMLQAQFALAQYQVAIGYDSAMISTLKTLMQGIISKI